MATKNVDTAAEKAKKQKIILVVGAVLLVGLAALQGPKLLKHGGGTATAAPPATTTDSSTAATEAPAAAPATSTTVVVTSTAKPATYVAGVGIPRGASARPGTSQLASFTLFEPKDPFVQQADETAGGGAGSGQPGAGTPDSGSAAATGGSSSSPAPSGSGSGATQAPPPPPIVYATIDLDGKPQQVQVKDSFPKATPLFVLRSLTKKAAKIAVAGGSFDDGNLLTLKLNKKVTLLNTATGVRYELKLVYAGAVPEVIEGFTTEQSAPSGSSGSSGTQAATAAGASSGQAGAGQ